MKDSIAAVVVTFNRLALLQECVSGLRNQRKKPDAIIIVDNGSTDGTSKWLDEQNDLHVIHQENSGSAGGFYSGMEEAFYLDFEWIWVMDDDVEPLENALEDLLEYSNISKCIHGSRIDSAGRIYKNERFLDFRSAFCYGSEGHSNLEFKEYFFANVACFEGMLIHREIVAKIGLPDRRFFINGDDTLYGFLASQYTSVMCINRIILKRKIIKVYPKTFWGGSLDVSPANSYFYYRNRFLTKKLLKETGYYKVEKFNRDYIYRISKDIMKSLLALKLKYVRSLVLATF